MRRWLRTGLPALVLGMAVVGAGIVGFLFSPQQKTTEVTIRPSFGFLLVRVDNPDRSQATAIRAPLGEQASAANGSVLTLLQDGNRVILRTTMPPRGQRSLAIRTEDYRLAVDRVLRRGTELRLSLPALLDASVRVGGVELPPAFRNLAYQHYTIPPGAPEVAVTWKNPWPRLLAILGLALTSGMMGYILGRLLVRRVHAAHPATNQREIYLYSCLSQLPGAVFIILTAASSLVTYLIFFMGISWAVISYLTLAGTIVFISWYPFRSRDRSDLDLSAAGAAALTSLPFLLYLVLRLFISLTPLLARMIGSNPVASAILDVALIIASFLATPYLIPPVLGLTGPNDDKLRGALEKLSTNPFRRIYIMRSGKGGTANAMVMGIMPAASDLIVTERLLAELDEEEIVAILEHETGHIRRAHLFKQVLLYLVFVIATGVLLSFLGSLAALLDGLLPGLILLAYLPLSKLVGRRYEWEADGYAVSVLGPERKIHLASALRRLSAINGTLPPLFGSLLMSHPPIVNRVARIMGYT